MFSVVNDLRTKPLELSRLQRRTFFLWNFFKEGGWYLYTFFCRCRQYKSINSRDTSRRLMFDCSKSTP